MNKQQQLMEVLKEKLNQATPFQLAVLKSRKTTFQVYKEVGDLWFDGVITQEQRQDLTKQLDQLDKLIKLVKLAAEAAEGGSHGRSVGFFNNQQIFQEQSRLFAEQQLREQQINRLHF